MEGTGGSLNRCSDCPTHIACNRWRTKLLSGHRSGRVARPSAEEIDSKLLQLCPVYFREFDLKQNLLLVNGRNHQ